MREPEPRRPSSASAPPCVDASPLTDDDVRHFDERGYVVVRDLLSDAELRHYGAAVDSAVAARTRWDDRALEERTRYEQSFRQCLNLWEDAEDVRPLSFHPRVGEVAARLLGASKLRIWHDQALYKEAGGRVTDPHQDQPYWAIAEPRTITAWIPFDGSRRATGAMSYLPGSHRSGLEKFADIFSGDGLDLDAHPETRGRAFDLVEVPLGAVAFHHGLTVHSAHPNRSTHTRRVHTIIYFADGCTRNARRHPSVDRAAIAEGARIESTVTPIAWPLEDGRLPAPPPLPDPPLPGWAGWRGDPDVLRKIAQAMKRA